MGVCLALIVLLVGGLFVIMKRNKPATTQTSTEALYDGTAQNTIELVAKGGFTPSNILAKSETNYKLKVKTTNTFDCSSSLVIPSLNIREQLPPTGQVDIEIPPQKAGTVINGTCTMGMYSFRMTFN